MTKEYQIFSGSNVIQMPRILAQGKVPLSVAYVMKERLNGNEEMINKYWDTSDLIAYDSKGNSNNLKFLLTVDNKNQVTEHGKEALELIHYDNKSIFEDAIEINNQYKKMIGDGFIEIARKDLGKIESRLSPLEILNSKTWRILARHPDEVPKEFAITDKYDLDGKEVDLLTKYVNWIQKQTNDTQNMGVYLDSQGKKAKLRALYVNGVEYRSNVVGRCNLGSGGRFAVVSGVVAGESSQRKATENKDNLVVPNLEEILKYSSDFVSPREKEAFEEGLEKLYQRK